MEETKPPEKNPEAPKVQAPKPVEHKPSNIQPPKLSKKMKQNPWIVSTLILGIITIILIVGDFGGGMTGGITGGAIGVAPENEVGTKVLDFIEKQTGEKAEIVEINMESGLYAVTVLFQGREVPVYVTSDGQNLVQGVTPFSVLTQQAPPQQQPTNVPKSDKPIVELFVMTHCPYGTQAEKGFIPAILELGDNIDSSIKFVHYFLHEPENDETPIQVCIREEQPDKFYAYLKCFLEDGDSDRCVKETGINKAQLDTCIEGGKADSYYSTDSSLSEGYGVRGSPSLVINGQIVNSGRSADAYLKTICSAFNDAPDVCNSELDTASPSPGFGYGTTSGIANAQC